MLAHSNSVEGGAAATALGITFGPSASGSRARTTGQSIEIEFSYDVEEAMTTPAFCASLEPRVRVKGDPFVDILDGVKEQYLRFGHGQPKVQLGSVAYTSEFEVETERSGELAVLQALGAGAVVEGAFAADGTFRATSVIAKHDEKYAPPSPGKTPVHSTP